MPDPAENMSVSPPETQETERLRAALDGTNINASTFLATDYLNHFNEVVMMVELVPDMPECLAETREWSPKSYTSHFEDSGFSAKELAIRAYHHAPADIRQDFDSTVDQLNQLVAVSLDRLGAAVETGNAENIRIVAGRASQNLRRLIDIVGAIINGTKTTINQDEIDSMFAEELG